MAELKKGDSGLQTSGFRLQAFGFRLLALPFSALLLFSCGGDYAPKPRGFFRIELPEKEYRTFSGACPFTFDYPVYARVVNDSLDLAQTCFYNVIFPQFNGRIHLSYQPVTSKKRFDELVEDAYKLSMKHTVKATGIDNQYIAYPDRKVYGIKYLISGNTASSVQFFLTDSVHHYLRGALYFHEAPRLDSIKPVLDFIDKDVDRMIKSFRWKN